MTTALRTAQPPVVDLRIMREDPKTTVYRVVVFDTAPLAACVVTCTREPTGAVWHGSCAQWQAQFTCPHIGMAQAWEQQGRQPQQAPDSLLTQLQQLRRQVKQDGPPKHPKPTPRRWRPTIEHVAPGPALQALDQTPRQAQGTEEVKTPVLQARPRRQQQAQEKWRQFNEQTATKYKVETPGHHCPAGWHTGDDGKCHPADAEQQQRARQEHDAQPDNVTKHHEHLLTQLSGGAISDSKRLDPDKSGVNQTHIITLKDDGQGIYKPAAGAGLEMGAENERLLAALPPAERFTYDHLLRNQHRREALFYDLERRFMATHLTPPTTLRHDSSGGEGSVQHMVTGARTLHEIPKDERRQLVETDPCLKRSLQDLLAVDLFQGSADRRTPNVMVQQTKPGCHQAVAIDNGISGQLPTLGGNAQDKHAALDLGVNQLRPEHVATLQKVVDGGMAPLIHRAIAHGLHPNEGRQRYLNALFVTRKLKTEPIKDHDDLADQYIDFLLDAAQDQSLPHDVRETVHAAIEQKLLPYDEDERTKGIAKFTPKPERTPAKETGPAATAPTQLKSLRAVAAAPITVAVMKLGQDKPLATFTLSGTRLTVDNSLFYADLRRLPYHFGGPAKLLALVQQYATAAYLHLRFVHGSLDELVAQVPKTEVQLPAPVVAQREFAAKLQARLAAAKRN